MSKYSSTANAIRALSMDAVQKAASGHPGAPMGMAEVAEVLWRDYLRHNPNNPNWINRDRFVLSNGHASMLLYSLLHLTGYDLSIDDIKDFRQLDSKTPGHPEYKHTPGVETTTGPLGQGFANAVGMALAARTLGAQFNKPESQLIDHFTYAFVGDGCLMEGISHEAASLAGTQGLGKLICFFDDNGISIDGDVKQWCNDDTPERFRAYNWQVIDNVDGYDHSQIKQAIAVARADELRPTLICCKTIIGCGSPNRQGSAGAHGAPLGTDEVAATRQEIGWDQPEFQIPDDIYLAWNAAAKGERLESDWQAEWEYYQQNFPTEAKDLTRRLSKKLPDSFAAIATSFIENSQKQKVTIATRNASKNCLQEFASVLPELIGGSADLSGSVGSLWGSTKAITSSQANGNYIHYGVREFAMAAVMNGIALYGGFINFGATFLIFRDYAANAMRLSALMQLQAIYVLTHDSIGLGEDGPTHQPIEQLASMRATPGLHLWRPSDSVETAVAWQAAISNTTNPSALVFSRQNLPCQHRAESKLKDIARGGYTLIDAGITPDLILIGSGSEVNLLVEAHQKLLALNINTSVVSMPCCEVFDRQDAEYRNKVLPPAVTARVAVEAASKDYWYKYVGLDGGIIAMESFGASAPADKLMQKFGFTVDNIVATAKTVYQKIAD